MEEPILDSRAKSAFKIEDREGTLSIYSQSLVNDEVLIDLVMYLAKKQQTFPALSIDCILI